MFIEHLPSAGHCSRTKDHSSEQNNVPASMELIFWGGDNEGNKETALGSGES